MSETTDDAPQALFFHCRDAYNRMFAQAHKAELDGGEEVLVYEGALTKLIASELNLSIPYYSSITRTLKAMGCIRQLKRGGGNSPSQWEVITEPTEAEFNLVEPKKSRRHDKYDMVQGQLNSLNVRVLQLEDTVQKLLGIGA